MATKPKLAAFNQGITPTIACFNKSLTALDLKSLVAAMQIYVTRDVAPVWGTPANLVVTNDFVKGSWAIVFLDTADVANALAYHDLTPDGLPLSKVFVKTIKQAKEILSVAASHELVEMLVDPAINMLTTGPSNNTIYAYESADPVESSFYLINNIAMSNFVYPSYFEGFRKPQSVPFDKMQKVTQPFQLLPGGYQIIYRNGKWSQIYGSVPTEKRIRKEDRRQHRGEQRTKRVLIPSAP